MWTGGRALGNLGPGEPFGGGLIRGLPATVKVDKAFSYAHVSAGIMRQVYKTAKEKELWHGTLLRLCQQGLHREPQQHVDVLHVLPGLTPSHVLNKEANE